MMSWLRSGWRGTDWRLSCDMLVPIISQPILVLGMSFYCHDSILSVSFICGVIILVVATSTKLEWGSQILYYWIASSVTYMIIIFENVVVSLSEIETEENFALVLSVVFALIFLTLARKSSEDSNGLESSFSNGALTESCSICRAKMNPREFHCHICQMCVPKYDYHCYWLNCCIGEANRHFFVVGVAFGMLAFGYASLLILTTICQPEFILGVLLPHDCTDVGATLEMFTCFVCGIYCMELALLLLLQLSHQIFLISTGYSALELKERLSYNVFHKSPFSRGFCGNWLHFFKSFRKKITL